MEHDTLCDSAEDSSHLVSAEIPGQVPVETEYHSVSSKSGELPMGQQHSPEMTAREVIGGDAGPMQLKEMSQDSSVRPGTSQAPHNPSSGLDCPAGYDQVMTFKPQSYYAVCISVQLAQERDRPTLNMT